MKIFSLFIDNGGEYRDHFNDTATVAAEDIEKARVEALKIVRSYFSTEQVTREYRGCRTLLELLRWDDGDITDWVRWIGDKEVPDYETDSTEIPWFHLKELELENGYEIVNFEVKKVENHFEANVKDTVKVVAERESLEKELSGTFGDE